MNEIIKSMEQYFDERIAKTQFHSELSAKVGQQPNERNSARVRIRNLIKAADRLGIDISIYKENTDRYRIRPTTETLFDYICLLDTLYGKKILAKQFSDIPVQDLFSLRTYLLYALYDAGLNESQVKKELDYFERNTSCPTFAMSKNASQLTQEAVEYWKLNYRIEISPGEWEMFSGILEEFYADVWRPRFIQLAHEKLMGFLALRGYDVASIAPDEMNVDTLFSKEKSEGQIPE